MKEMLQTNCLSNKHQYCAWSICICIIHVEPVAQDYVAVEEEAAAKDQEEQPLQELEVVDPAEEQDPSDLANPDQQPGKLRFIDLI